MSTNSTFNKSARALRRTIALGGLGAFLAVVGGPSCAEIQTTGPTTATAAPKPPSRANRPDLASDDYFDQLLSVDSHGTAQPAGTTDQSTSLTSADINRVLSSDPNAQLHLAGVTNVVASASKPTTTTNNPAISQSWQELVQTVAAQPGSAATGYNNPVSSKPASVVSVNPTFTKPSASKAASNPAPVPSTSVAHSKPVEPTTPVSTPIVPDVESSHTLVSTTTTTTTTPVNPDTSTPKADPVELSHFPNPGHSTIGHNPDPAPNHDPESTSVAAVNPSVPTTPDIKPVEPAHTTTIATSPTPPAPTPVYVTPTEQAAAHIQPPATGFGLFTLTMRLAALAALLATGTFAFLFSKSTDRAGITARSFNLRTRFILAFGGFATITQVVCAFASVYIATSTGVMTMAACALGSIAAAVVTCLWLERATSQPLARINRTIRALATGDMLQKPINSSVRDEFGDLARGVDRLTSSMRDALTEIAISSNEICGAAGQVATGVQQMTSAATDVAKQCADASRAAAEVSRDATDGHGAISQTADGVSALSQIASSHASGIKSIQSRSQQVADLVKLIDELAERTNVVALNASVEASRSGPSSRTFAMLADEARRLSEQAQSAAAEAAQTVQSLAAEATAACEKVAGSESQIRQGAALASKARADYETISSRTFTVAGAMQKAGIAAEGFGNNAAASEAAATQLATRSNHMMSVMKRFKLDTSKLVPVNNRSNGQVVEQVSTAV